MLLLGVDQRVNTSIHYAERVAGRKQFLRWALTLEGVVECPGFPGCSDGFDALALHLPGITHSTRIGGAEVHAMPLTELIEVARRVVEADPLALLCRRAFCGRCEAVRKSVACR